MSHGRRKYRPSHDPRIVYKDERKRALVHHAHELAHEAREAGDMDRARLLTDLARKVLDSELPPDTEAIMRGKPVAHHG